MTSDLTPTEVAYIMLALMQSVASALWLVGGWVMRDTQRAATHWSAFAGLSAVSFLFLVLAMQADDAQTAEWLRAAGNLCGVLGMMALQRGVWLFTGQPLRLRGQVLALMAALAASWIGLQPAAGHIRVGVNSGVMAIVAFGIALDLYRHGRDSLGLRWPLLLSLPVLLAGGAFAARGLRAWFAPGAVLAEMTVSSGLNVASAFAYVVLALSFHATLMVMVVARLVVDLQRLSRCDGLTGLLNRRALEEALALQVRRGRRNGEPFCVLMLDADHFKRINDRFGHAVGDLALKHLSSLLLDHMREVDRLARFGGEEFLVLLPGLTMPSALPVAERLRAVIAAAPLQHADAVIPLSVSIGIAEWAGAGEDSSRLLVRADAALYQAKRSGRDQVASAGTDAVPAWQHTEVRGA